MSEPKTPSQHKPPRLMSLHGGAWGSLLNEGRYQEMLEAASLDLSDAQEHDRKRIEELEAEIVRLKAVT
jgi:hypothetical protein